MNKLLLDMGLPRRAAADLRQMGFDVRHVGELGMAAAKDSEILSLAASERSAVVTLDADFARIVSTEGKSVPSVIHVRIPNLDRSATVQLLREILPVLAEDLARGCIASVGPQGIRIRNLPVFG